MRTASFLVFTFIPEGLKTMKVKSTPCASKKIKTNHHRAYCATHQLLSHPQLHFKLEMMQKKFLVGHTYVVDIFLFLCIFTQHDFRYKSSISYDCITLLMIPSEETDIGANFCPLPTSVLSWLMVEGNKRGEQNCQTKPILAKAVLCNLNCF